MPGKWTRVLDERGRLAGFTQHNELKFIRGEKDRIVKIIGGNKTWTVLRDKGRISGFREERV
jgi:hypothetical protein